MMSLAVLLAPDLRSVLAHLDRCAGQLALVELDGRLLDDAREELSRAIGLLAGRAREN